MNHRNNQNKKMFQEENKIKMKNKQSNIYRSCLKQTQNGQTIRLSNGHVSFAHPNLNNEQILLSSQSEINSNEKNHRSITFAKKAKEFQLDELNYFKDHARDKQQIDE